MKPPKCICVAVVTMLCCRVYAQSAVDEIDSLAGRLVTVLRTEDKDKILLQTDRKVYAAGEKIWFKAFVVSTLANRLDTATKNLFVDLVDEDDTVINKVVLNAAARSTAGAITLSDSLATGYYWLRGYTQRMLDEDTSGIFLQPVYIMNIKKPAADNRAAYGKITGNLDIHFFPEGGTIITGINSTGALQVKDAAGNPVIVAGYVADNKDSPVAVFNTNRFGLARVTFYPKWFQTYKAVIHSGDGDVAFPLRKWNPYAAQVSIIKQDKKSLHAYITLEDSIYTRKYTTYLLAVNGDSICFAGIGRGMCQVDIPLSDFPGGVATLFLFNEEKQLVSERNVFIDKDNYALKIKPDKENYAARDKANLTLEVTDTYGQPLIAALNVAVEDSRVMGMSDLLEADTLQPAALSLGDWLKRNGSGLTKEEIDLFMLAQPAKQVADSIKIPEAYRDNNELLVNLKGKVADRRNNPLKSRVVTEMSQNGSDVFLDVDTTGIGGGFRLRLPQNRGSNPLLMLQVTDKRGNVEANDSLTIDAFQFPKFRTPSSLKGQFSLAKIEEGAQIKKYHIDSLLTGSGNGWLKPVTITAKQKKPDTYENSKRVNPFSYIIPQEAINQGGFGSIGNVLLNVPGVSLKGRFVQFFGGSGFGTSEKTEPIVVMDGVQVPVAQMYPPDLTAPVLSPVMNFLNSLSSTEIDFIEILRGADAGIYGVRGGNGAIVINTKTHGTIPAGPAGFKNLTVKTYHMPPPFLMPDYSNIEIKTSKAPDLRNTIYWNGNLRTDVNGKASASFYTADAATTYTIVVTGITANGDYVYKRVTVNRNQAQH